MSDAVVDPHQQALQRALDRLLAPLATLAVARGLPYAAIDTMLRAAFVAAAHAAHPGLPAHRRTSRISATTGLNRREVLRLQELLQKAATGGAPPPPASRASEVFAHWRAEPGYRQPDGRPRPLPRTGPAPSFETLAQEVTRDVHPRSLLEELLRLRLAELDPQRDEVRLLEDAFVPRADAARMADFLGANVGDHLQAAVDNVLGDGLRHFEQAIFADGLSDASLAAIKPMIVAQWRQMTETLVPALERLVAADEADPPQATRRLRLGLYSFDDGQPGSSSSVPADDAEPAPLPTIPPAPSAGAKTRRGGKR